MFISTEIFYAQVIESNQSKLFSELQTNFLKPKNSTEKFSLVVTKVAQSFVGYPYVEHSLELSDNENVVVNLNGFDCTTFVESVLALSRTFWIDGDFKSFKQQLQEIRYRNGVLNGYCSRLHYFSEWITDNVKKKTIADVTRELGGESTYFNVSFMSLNPRYYSALISSVERIDSIKDIEKNISGREFYVIPKLKVKMVESKINEGDIIAFTTSLNGLDIGHIGIAIRDNNGKLHLIHAPSAGKQVQITTGAISDYILSVKKHSGMIVLRPIPNTGRM